MYFFSYLFHDMICARKHLILFLQYILFVFLKEARGCVISNICTKVPCFCSGSLFKGIGEKSRKILLVYRLNIYVAVKKIAFIPWGKKPL